MGRKEFRDAYRQARLIDGIAGQTGHLLSMFDALPLDVRLAYRSRTFSDVLAYGYEGLGHRCGRRRPRYVGGPCGVLPA